MCPILQIKQKPWYWEGVLAYIYICIYIYIYVSLYIYIYMYTHTPNKNNRGKVKHVHVRQWKFILLDLNSCFNPSAPVRSTCRTNRCDLVERPIWGIDIQERHLWVRWQTPVPVPLDEVAMICRESSSIVSVNIPRVSRAASGP